jgi:hypothetical protein
MSSAPVWGGAGVYGHEGACPGVAEYCTEARGRLRERARHPDVLGGLLEMAGLADLVTDGDGIPTGTPKLIAQYIPNLKPAKRRRHLPAAANLGR